MQENKENIVRLKEKSRIPLPEDPLPPLPKYLTRSKFQKNAIAKGQRKPLKTINSQSGLQAGHSDRSGTSLLSQEIDSRNVTVRHKKEDLDWDLKIFNDNDKDCTVISISDDEISVKQEKQINEPKHYPTKTNIVRIHRTNTPALEPNRVKNIKRSLKRPHSKELQGLSPPVAPENKEASDVHFLTVRDPLQEDQSLDIWAEKYTKYYERNYSEDLFSYLLSVEKFATAPRIPSITRACVLNWLIKINGPHGNPAIIQTACWYMDSLLSQINIDIEQLQKVAAACYFIAKKFYSPGAKASRLFKCAKKVFTPRELFKAEKAILKKLNFPAKPVIPQDYITYLSWVAADDKSGEVEMAATFLCMCGMMVDKTLCTVFPSIIAVACVRNSLRLLGKSNLLQRLRSNTLYQAAEKKTLDMCCVCSTLCRAVRTVSNSKYEYKMLMEHFGRPPSFTAQKVVDYVNELALLET